MVHEEEDEHDDRDVVTVRNVSQIPSVLCDNIYEDIIYEFVLLHADSIIRAKSFLLMIIHRNRYLKLKSAAAVIQGRCKQYLAKTLVKKLRQERIDEERRKLLEKYL